MAALQTNVIASQNKQSGGFDLFRGEPVLKPVARTERAPPPAHHVGAAAAGRLVGPAADVSHREVTKDNDQHIWTELECNDITGSHSGFKINHTVLVLLSQSCGKTTSWINLPLKSKLNSCNEWEHLSLGGDVLQGCDWLI